MKTATLTFLFLSLLPLRAAEPADPTAKLREQLRSALLQLRTAQTDAANARAAQSLADARNQELTDQLAAAAKRTEALAKERNAEKTASDRTIAGLNNRLADREKRIAEYTEALEKWKDGYTKAAQVAREKEEERARLAAEIIVHRRTIADRESRNLSLFNTATEILDRFEKFSLGKAIAAREPFIGTQRVKIENLVQGYRDRIIDQRIPAANP